MGKTVVTFDTVRALALALPDVEDSTSYGTPSLKAKGKFMARLREDGDVVFKIGFDNAEMLMQTTPEVFYITDHYRGYPAVLARMSRVTKKQLADVVQMAWLYTRTTKKSVRRK
jgi:hypothetical protein